MRAREIALAAIGYFGLALIWLAPLSRSLSDTVLDLGDPLHLAWVLAWNAHQLVREPWALFDSNSFFPHRGSLAFSDHLLPQGVLVAPVFWFTENAVLAANCARLAMLTLNAVSLYALLRWTGLSTGPAALGGIAYAFNSFSRGHLALVHALSIGWWPLALMLLLSFTESGRPRTALAAAGAFSLQGLSYSYYLLYSTLLAPCWLALAYLFVRRWPTRRELAVLLISALGAACLVGLVVKPYLQLVPGLPMSVMPPEPWRSFIDPGPDNWLWSGGAGGGSFIGFFTLSLAGVGAAGLLLRAVGDRAWRVGSLAVFCAVTGLVLQREANLVVGGLALAGRTFPLLILGFAVSLAIGTDLLTRRLGRHARLATLAVLAVLIPLEHWGLHRAPVAVPVGGDVPAVYRWLARGESEPIIELPHYGTRGKRLFAAYLYFSTYHWRPIVLGRTSLMPPGHDFLAWLVEEFPSRRSIAVLAQLGVRQVVVHPRMWSEAVRAERLRALAAQPQLELERGFDASPKREFAMLGLGAERIYRILPGPIGTACEPTNEVPREEWSSRASGEASTRLARDGDPATAWASEDPQSAETWLRVQLPKPTALAAISVQLPPEEFPRDLLLDAKAAEGDPWDAVAWYDDAAARWEALHALLQRPRRAFLVLRFATRLVSSFRLRVGYQDSVSNLPRWTVPELHAYRDCR